MSLASRLLLTKHRAEVSAYVVGCPGVVYQRCDSKKAAEKVYQHCKDLKMVREVPY